MDTNPLTGSPYISITDSISPSETVDMQMPGTAWSTEQMYTFTSPTTS